MSERVEIMAVYAANLVAKMLKERGWGTDRLRRHWDWTKKICPRLMYDEGRWTGWTVFCNMVGYKLRMKEGDEGMYRELLEKVNKQQYTIDALARRLDALESSKSMPVPDWAKAAVDAAVAAGIIDTPDGGSYDFYRVITVLHRRGLLDGSGFFS